MRDATIRLCRRTVLLIAALPEFAVLFTRQSGKTDGKGALYAIGRIGLFVLTGWLRKPH